MTIDTVELWDKHSGSRAKILAGRGFNCCSFTVLDEGRPCELLWAAPHFAEGQARDSSSGIPILFPFAGRIHGTQFTFGGQAYELEAGDALGNAIHGFVMGSRWDVIDRTPTRVVGRIQALLAEPALLRHWPADFRLTVAYELADTTLRAAIEIDNPDRRPLPFWFGLHPYFRLPLVPGGNADECRIVVPAGSYWPLEDMLPAAAPLATEGPRQLASGRRFADTQLDDVFTDLKFERGLCTASIHDPAAGKTLFVRFDERFNTCVVYTPPHREAICIEPYTALPDAFRLAGGGVHTGLRVLEPGESFTAAVEIGFE